MGKLLNLILIASVILIGGCDIKHPQTFERTIKEGRSSNQNRALPVSVIFAKRL
jgi:hypothetical protein